MTYIFFVHRSIQEPLQHHGRRPRLQLHDLQPDHRLHLAHHRPRAHARHDLLQKVDGQQQVPAIRQAPDHADSRLLHLSIPVGHLAAEGHRRCGHGVQAAQPAALSTGIRNPASLVNISFNNFNLL